MRSRQLPRLVFLASLLAAALAGTTVALAQPCVVQDDGSGTVSLPPVGCNYLSASDVHMIINGLPPGTTIQLAPIHREFACRAPAVCVGGANNGHPCTVPADCPGGSCIPGGPHCGTPGGGLGGEQEQFNSIAHFQAQGTGTLSGFSRTIDLALLCTTHTGPRTPGQPVQSFPTEMFAMQGQLPPGDPDFDLLRVTAGSAFGMPSPGHTTLTSLPGGNWAVDSFFDVFYKIDFIGHSPGPLAGRSGSTTATIRMATQPSAGIPTLSEWGMIIAVLVLMTVATLYMTRKRTLVGAAS